MAFIDDKNYFNFGVDIEESLDEEAVRDLEFFSFGIFEAWAVIEGQLLDDYLGGNGGLWIFFMSDFDFGVVLVVEVGFESIVFDNKFWSAEEGHDGGLTDTSISDDDDGFFVLVVDGDGG